MTDENPEIYDPNFFLPKDDMFSIFLNSTENMKPSEMNM
jgi:hypothetical protein